MTLSGWRAGATALAVAGIVAAAPAQADFTVCNDSFEDDFIAVAIAYSDDGIWVSSGWWDVAWDECVTVINGDLDNRYYYIRGEGDSGGAWEDDYTFCVDPEYEFEVRGGANCATRGLASAGFFEVDVGDAFDWTIGLRD